MTKTSRPKFYLSDVENIVESVYGLQVNKIGPLSSDRDLNYFLAAQNSRAYVLKIYNPAEPPALLRSQVAAMRHLGYRQDIGRFPEVVPDKTGGYLASVVDAEGRPHYLRLVRYLEGKPLAEVQPHSAELFTRLGQMLGRMDRSLAELPAPEEPWELLWDLQNAGQTIEAYSVYVQGAEQRELVQHFLRYWHTHVAPALPMLRRSLIHNDANDYNVLVSAEGALGLIDFGDLVYGPTVIELAVAAAYCSLDKDDPLEAVAPLIAGYHQANPLSALEIELLYYLLALRLCLSVVISAYQQPREPDNDYLSISAAPAWNALRRLANIAPHFANMTWREACGLPAPENRSLEAMLAHRRQHLGYNLSVAYRQPLKIVRGAGQYLYDERGHAYLDMVNNVCHVGHGHPHVVRAGQRQMAILNTNTRYLHDNILAYSERLLSKFPPPLSVVYFVCSGSEANELALRMARTHTGKRDIVVLDVAYHGNTGGLIDISPYKHNAPGGQGPPPYVHTAALPDSYRGIYRGQGLDVGRAYAREVQRALNAAQDGVAAFIHESLPGCGGQIVLPAGYLKEAYRYVRSAGGVCIADEVQVGFGRVGSHFWGFETQGVVPDIVTLGKPIGNGHPLAAVVTTPEIAASFNNGMEYFNTFGGNPVSCAIGKAVLDVIENENLQEHAQIVGARLMDSVRQIQPRHPLIGDVRGLGLFIGIELVRDHETLEPATEEADEIINLMKARGFLLSTDGPDHNVIKIKPPLVFSSANVDAFVTTLDQVLEGF